jgi:hypothetical protein
MLWTLFIVWLLTAVLCGWNVAASEATWKHLAVWSVTAFGGAGLMILALYLRARGY